MIDDPLPTLSTKYSEDFLVLSSVVLQLDWGSWVFISNARNRSNDPYVNVYCPNLVNFMYPLHESLKSVFKHFFPSKRLLIVYSSTSGLDMDGSFFSLLKFTVHLYSIANRMINSKMLAAENIYRTTINAYVQSVEHQKVLRFTDNEMYTVFILLSQWPDISYSIEFFTFK